MYRGRSITRDLIRRAEDAGCEALVLTVDAAEIGTRERDNASGFHLPHHDHRKSCRHWQREYGTD